MDPITLMALAQSAGIGLTLAGSIVGRILSEPDRKKQRELMEQAQAEFNIPLPELERVVVTQQGGTEFDNIKRDGTADNAQRMALADLQRVGQQGADNIEFRAATDAAAREGNRAAGARDASILQEMQARGMRGSGLEMAARLQSNQNASERQSARGFDAAVAGRQQALAAMQAAGSLGGQMRGQQWQEQSGGAAAADSINRFNAGAQNQANYYNAGLAQQNFQNQMGLAGARANAATNTAGFYGQQARETQGMWSGVGAAAGQGASAIGTNAANQQNYDEWLKKTKPPGGA